MQYVCPMLVVADMERSKAFYRNYFGLTVVADYGANVSLSGGVSLQTLDSWCQLLKKNPSEITFRSNACELYFETEDLEAFCRCIGQDGALLPAHPLLEHPWGQRAIRLYDPDGHLLEVGEPLSAVAKRFLTQGMTPEQAAARMEVPLASLLEWIKA